MGKKSWLVILVDHDQLDKMMTPWLPDRGSMWKQICVDVYRKLSLSIYHMTRKKKKKKEKILILSPTFTLWRVQSLLKIKTLKS